METEPRRRPHVTIHYAQTLDGRIATSTGHSQWVSGSESLQLAHHLRATHQAVLVGVGTVLADNPRLTVRLVEGRSPERVVADCSLRLPLDSHLLTDGAAKTWIAVTQAAPDEQIAAVRALGAEVVVIDQAADGHVDLALLLDRLGSAGIESVLIEGGQSIITAALRGHLVDRLVVCIAPKVIGFGIDAVGDLGVQCLGDALTFSDVEVTQLGPDIIFDGRDPAAPAT